MIFEDPANKDRWDKYVYLTHDVDSESPDLKPFDQGAIETMTLPRDWSAARAEAGHQDSRTSRTSRSPIRSQPSSGEESV